MSTLDQYRKIRSHYCDANVASTYESERFGGRRGRIRNGRVLNAVRKALDSAAQRGHPVYTLLDIPVGTGRLAPLVWDTRCIQGFVGDISLEMMHRLGEKAGATGMSFPCVQCDAERLPFAGDAFDVTVSLRFMFHLPRDVRVTMLKELRRVSSRWVIYDCRNTRNLRYLASRLKRCGRCSYDLDLRWIH